MLFAGLWITLSKKVIMKEKRTEDKITIKEIFSDHWPEFKQYKWHTIPENMKESVEEAVLKMLGCGDPKNGYTKFMCTQCGEAKIVGFTCKRRFWCSGLYSG